ncbi:MAG: hypothetical protein JWM56_1296 [Candidatus Peribacteria bacterium]|nr:hypothetical protein [Candidatus Peribacteria bacterium]
MREYYVYILHGTIFSLTTRFKITPIITSPTRETLEGYKS